MSDPENFPIHSAHGPNPPSVVQQLAEIPEEEIWLAKQKSARTRRAYRLDVRHFMATVAVTGREELRQVDHQAVIAWERHMRETQRPALDHPPAAALVQGRDGSTLIVGPV